MTDTSGESNAPSLPNFRNVNFPTQQSQPLATHLGANVMPRTKTGGPPSGSEATKTRKERRQRHAVKTKQLLEAVNKAQTPNKSGHASGTDSTDTSSHPAGANDTPSTSAKSSPMKPYGHPPRQVVDKGARNANEKTRKAHFTELYGRALMATHQKTLKIDDDLKFEFAVACPEGTQTWFTGALERVDPPPATNGNDTIVDVTSRYIRVNVRIRDKPSNNEQRAYTNKHNHGMWIGLEQLCVLTPATDTKAVREAIAEITAVLLQDLERPGSVGAREPALQCSKAFLLSEGVRVLKRKAERFPLATMYCYTCEYHISSVSQARSHLTRTEHVAGRQLAVVNERLRHLPFPTQSQVRAITKLLTATHEKDGVTAEDRTDVANTLSDIEERLNESLTSEGDLKLRLYGSYQTLMGLNNRSNVNVELIFDDEKTTHSKALQLVAKWFREHKDDYGPIVVDFDGRCPAITFQVETRNYVLSVCNEDAYIIGTLIEAYGQCNPLLAQLAHVWRKWANMISVDDYRTGGVPPYALDLMLIHYLQKVNELPFLHEIFAQMCGAPEPEEGCCKFTDWARVLKLVPDHWTLPPTDKLKVGATWLGLLKYYSVDIKHGSHLSQIVTKRKRTRDGDKKWTGKRIGIEDPVLPDKNANQMSTKMFDYFMQCLRTTYYYYATTGNKETMDTKTSRQESRDTTNASMQEQPCSESPTTSNRQSEDTHSSWSHEATAGWSESEKNKANGQKTDVTNGGLTEDRLASFASSDTVTLEHQVSSDVILKEGEVSLDDVTTTLSMNRESSTVWSTQVTVDDQDEDDEDEDVANGISTEENGSDSTSGEENNATRVTTDVSTDSDVIFARAAPPEDVPPTFISDGDESDNDSDREVTTLTRQLGSTTPFASTEDESGTPIVSIDDVQPSITEMTRRRLSSVDVAFENETPSPVFIQPFEVHSSPSGSPCSSEEAAAYGYKFNTQMFTSGQRPQLHCEFCQVIGHVRAECPLRVLPPLCLLPETMAPQSAHFITSMMTSVRDQFAQRPQRRQWAIDKCTELCELIQIVYPDRPCMLDLFGSTMNGFGFDASDLDLCLRFKGFETEMPADVNVREVMKKITKVLRHRQSPCCNVQPVLSAKVPIVKFATRDYGVDGDISLYNVLALRNTALMYAYASIDPRVRLLGLTVKFWAKSCDIGDASKGSLSSYAYILCMLHYLQRTEPPVLPVLQEMYDGDTKPTDGYIVNGHNTYFAHNADEKLTNWSKNTQSPGELWLGFLRYFCEEFDYSNVVQIRCSIDTPVSKFEKRWTSKPLAIEDPFDQEHNLSGGLGKKMFQYIRRCFIQARDAFGRDAHMEHAIRANLPADFGEMTKHFFGRLCRPKDTPPSDRQCHACGHVGHWAETCPRRQRNKHLFDDGTAIDEVDSDMSRKIEKVLTNRQRKNAANSVPQHQQQQNAHFSPHQHPRPVVRVDLSRGAHSHQYQQQQHGGQHQQPIPLHHQQLQQFIQQKYQQNRPPPKQTGIRQRIIPQQQMQQPPPHMHQQHYQHNPHHQQQQHALMQHQLQHPSTATRLLVGQQSVAPRMPPTSVYNTSLPAGTVPGVEPSAPSVNPNEFFNNNRQYRQQ